MIYVLLLKLLYIIVVTIININFVLKANIWQLCLLLHFLTCGGNGYSDGGGKFWLSTQRWKGCYFRTLFSLCPPESKTVFAHNFLFLSGKKLSVLTRILLDAFICQHLCSLFPPKLERTQEVQPIDRDFSPDFFVSLCQSVGRILQQHHYRICGGEGAIKAEVPFQVGEQLCVDWI